MLTDKIRLVGPGEGAEEQQPEDLFASALAVVFPDDCMNQWGDKENAVIYESRRFGDVRLELADPEGETNRRLFSHYLWNAGVQLAEFIEEAQPSSQWDVTTHRVLEVGAGTGLAGIMAALSGAQKVVISDYPAPEVLANIKTNVTKNVTKRNAEAKKLENADAAATEFQCEVMGHEWGVLSDAFSQENEGSFDRILVADCLWMPWQHANLQSSIRHFLSPEGRAWVVAGFHTGREKMAKFFEEEGLRERGLEVEKIWERSAVGDEREWVVDRGVEDVTERKRWLVIALLKRIDGT